MLFQMKPFVFIFETINVYEGLMCDVSNWGVLLYTSTRRWH